MDHGEPVNIRDHSGEQRGTIERKKRRKENVKIQREVQTNGCHYHLVWDWCLHIRGLVIDLLRKN